MSELEVIEKLHSLRDGDNSGVGIEEIDELINRVKKLEAALEFYRVQFDHGEKARKALEEE